MALQPCRSGLARSRQILRAPVLRACYATDSAPSNDRGNGQATSNTPRWAQTPSQMKAPIQMDFSKKPKNKVWVVNNDPQVLDGMYNRLLGPSGSKLLPEELKFLAVTHKSFDQGRRGFNDRLALLGRMTLVMETTKNIVSQAPLPGSKVVDQFAEQRQPFEHEQLRSVDNLNAKIPRDVASKEKLFALAESVGMIDVLRWKPRLPEALDSSGVETVMNGAIFAIIGAITLQHGSVVASQIIKERILPKL